MQETPHNQLNHSSASSVKGMSPAQPFKQSDEQSVTTRGVPSAVDADLPPFLDAETSTRNVSDPAPEDDFDVLSCHETGDCEGVYALTAEKFKDTGLESGNGAASLQEWPYFQTAVDFRLSAEEVRQRAAWAWYRTALICTQAGRRLKQQGQGQMPRDLGLDLLASNS